MVAFVANAQGQNETKPEFVPGQVWSIKSAHPTPAKVIIGRIEPLRNGSVVHVSIVDVPIPQGLRGAGNTITIGHMPFDKVVLLESLDRLLAVNTSPAPDFERGYQQWLAEKGGVFTVSVSKAIEIVFQSIASAGG